MKSSLVSVSGGATATDILATIPAKFVKVEQDGVAPTVPLLVSFRQANGVYSDEMTFGPGDVITHIREDGPVARPPSYSYSGQSAEAYMKIRTQDASTVSVRLFEYENIPRGSVL